MNRSFVFLALATLATGCAAANTGGSPGAVTESSLMQADRDFADATHARGIDGWMAFYTPDAIRIQYRGNMVKGLDAIRAELGADRRPRFSRRRYRLDDGEILGRESHRCERGKGDRARSLRHDLASRRRTMARHHGHWVSGASVPVT